jgi:hypothetical protein
LWQAAGGAAGDQKSCLIIMQSTDDESSLLIIIDSLFDRDGIDDGISDVGNSPESGPKHKRHIILQ